MDIGFIGLGNMGAHMARRLVEAGHKVFIYDTRRRRSATSRRSAASPCARPRKLPTPPRP